MGTTVQLVNGRRLVFAARPTRTRRCFTSADNHPKVVRVLELAEDEALEAIVPLDLADALTYCTAKGRVRVTDRVRIGWEGGKVTRKKAHELTWGDVIVLQPPDRIGEVVHRV